MDQMFNASVDVDPADNVKTELQPIGIAKLDIALVGTAMQALEILRIAPLVPLLLPAAACQAEQQPAVAREVPHKPH